MNSETLEKLLHECECIYLDFKRDQYPFIGSDDHTKSELLKDILALANAEKPGAGYILIGVEENRGARARVQGVTAHLNDHELQQFVSAKINRPLTFSYEVVACDGVSIGIIHIPVQDRCFYLKRDYGKLRANLAYYRLGSSTREASPDELLRWGKAAAVTNAQPRLELQFAHIRRPTVVGGSQVTAEAGTTFAGRIRSTRPVAGVELAKLCPPPAQHGFTREAEYWSDFTKHPCKN
jgi:hypothetical protein